jgi:hypothetical protein
MEPTEIRRMWEIMAPALDERQRRAYAATLANIYGYGGATFVHQQTGIALNTITAGKRDAQKGLDENKGRVRRYGGGPKLVERNNPQIEYYIRSIVDAHTYGDPQRILSWTTESLRKISEELFFSHKLKISHVTVSSILESMGYSKQANQKMLQLGKSHPDRNAQFEFINAKAKDFLNRGLPVISVDTKKKELIGNFKNNGGECRRKGDPRKVLGHDFPLSELGKIAPYGIYNLNRNIGFVNLGTSHDTSEFAAESVSRWWECLGKNTFHNSKELFITCDCGGSNGNRRKIWKYQLSQLASRAALDIHVSHFPPGTSKWNKVEHKLFCYTPKNWAGKSFVDLQTAVNLIGSTTTRQGLRVICAQDDSVYELAKKVTDEEYDSIPLTRIQPFEQWNYIIRGA